MRIFIPALFIAMGLGGIRNNVGKRTGRIHK